MKVKSNPISDNIELPKIDEGILSKQLEESHSNIRERIGKKTFNAYIFSIKTQKDNPVEIEESMQELKGLLETLGDKCVGSLTQNLPKPNPPTYVGAGKVQEISDNAKALNADYVVCDRELSASQNRNLEALIRLPVLDRSAIILQIFERNAKTREARLQVAIAHFEYLQPRLSSAWIAWERQGGSGGGGAAKSKGSGEKQLELDQREVSDRIASLKKELEGIRNTRRIQKKSRSKELKIAFVGYTNAGKTSWMNALTDSKLSVKNALFETLDSTVRTLKKHSSPTILVSDTVGFIRNLPHSLVASFRSTLEETAEADLLIHVIDASSEHAIRHIEVTNDVLFEIGAGNVPELLVFNKTDLLESELNSKEIKEQLIKVANNRKYIFVSSKNNTDIENCRLTILNILLGESKEKKIFIPYIDSDLLGFIYNNTKVISKKDDEEGIHLEISAVQIVWNQLDQLLHERGLSVEK